MLTVALRSANASALFVAPALKTETDRPDARHSRARSPVEVVDVAEDHAFLPKLDRRT